MDSQDEHKTPAFSPAVFKKDVLVTAGILAFVGLLYLVLRLPLRGIVILFAAAVCVGLSYRSRSVAGSSSQAPKRPAGSGRAPRRLKKKRKRRRK